MTGRVILVGGGPGDPGLITRAGWKALQQADVVVADRLAPLSLLAQLDPAPVVIDAAKVPDGRSMPQEQINAALIEHALAGSVVVRFKGGDGFVFGRGMEEVQACRAAGIPVEVIPGVSSAIAIPALADVAVTHKGLSQGFTVVSGHRVPDHPDSDVDWAALARTGTTLVLLMAVKTLPAITVALIDAGMARETPTVTIMDGGSPEERVLRSTLGEVGGLADQLAPPAITVIGAVAGLE